MRRDDALLHLKLANLTPCSESEVTSQTSKTEVSCNPALLSLFRCKSALLLQGPVGFFFDRLSIWLKKQGTQVHRVIFQGGDHYDCKKSNEIFFNGRLHDWSEFFKVTLNATQADHIILFGQNRVYHCIAIEVARELGIPIIVLEEGYFRPGFVTMELNGVNSYSSTLDKYIWQPSEYIDISSEFSIEKGNRPHFSKKHFRKMVVSAIKHYVVMHSRKKFFPYYIHHRESNIYWYLVYWIWSWVKKYWSESGDFLIQSRLISGGVKYFFVPLQFDGDSQIVNHSDYVNVSVFIEEVLRSFAFNATDDSILVFKLHPHSRGGPGYEGLICRLANELNIFNRVLYLIEGDAPLLAQYSKGVVVINSTVGLQALERGAPVIALGRAMFRKEGITFSDQLDKFWRTAHSFERSKIVHFLLQIKNLTQMPCSIYEDENVELCWPTLHDF